MKTQTFPAPREEYDEDETDSPAVKRIDRFMMDGKEFPTFVAAIEAREDKIEAFIRHLFRDSSPGDQTKHVQFILDNRAQLRSLLDY